MKKIRVLVFPCGSEIGLEIYRSLCFSNHIELFGANSTDDHGRFVYEKYIGGLPFVDSENLIPELAKVVSKLSIDAIYPTMDKVISILKSNEIHLGCKVISSAVNTAKVCLSKKSTYMLLKQDIIVPNIFVDLNQINKYPVFVKPDVGYGARGVFLANDIDSLKYFFRDKRLEDYVISEYLPGEEYTVDCFTDKNGELRFVGPRLRKRISNGISVNTAPIDDEKNEFNEIAILINKRLKFQGAWFYQLKRNEIGKLALLEIAARLGGSSSLYRGKGINFALLSIFDAFDVNIEILLNDYEIEEDRALYNKYKVGIDYSTVYVDLDDCLIIDNKINTQLVSFLYSAFNNGKKLILLSKHEGNIQEILSKFRLKDLFDEIINIGKSDIKSNYINELNSIFIDDSFSERKEIKLKYNIPVISPDMIEIL